MVSGEGEWIPEKHWSVYVLGAQLGLVRDYNFRV